MINAAKDYWELVENDPRDWDRNQKVLFWWIVLCLDKVRAGGVIAQPGEAPLNDDQIVEVIESVLPENGGEKSYLDQTWSYEGQSLLFPSSDGNIVSVTNGEISIIEDPLKGQREVL